MITTIAPFIISFLLGFFILLLIFKNDCALDGFKLVLAAGLGLGISALLGFGCLIIMDQYNAHVVLGAHAVLILALLIACIKNKAVPSSEAGIKTIAGKLIAFILFLIFCIPLWMKTYALPMGGWDAWIVWNFKAKMIAFGGTNWRNLFDPLLWRTSPHYPLLQPLINAWGWIFQNEAKPSAPMLTTVIFTMLNAALIYSIPKRAVPIWISRLAAAVFLTTPILLTYASSQYCDVVLGFFLCATLVSLWRAKFENDHRYTFISGLLCGCLSFTKPEAHIASLIIFLFVPPYILFESRGRHWIKQLKSFYGGAAITYLPALYFYVFMAPENITMTNALATQSTIENLLRAKAVLKTFFLDLFHLKWHGLWLLAGSIILANSAKASRSLIFIFPLVLFSYLAVILAYYFLNAHFEINWWMEVTLTRIMFSLLPAFMIWMLLTVGYDKKVME